MRLRTGSALTDPYLTATTTAARLKVLQQIQRPVAACMPKLANNDRIEWFATPDDMRDVLVWLSWQAKQPGSKFSQIGWWPAGQPFSLSKGGGEPGIGANASLTWRPDGTAVFAGWAIRSSLPLTDPRVGKIGSSVQTFLKYIP